MVTIPIRTIIPIWEKMFRVCPKSQSVIKAPAMAKGTVNMIVSGFLKLSNCAERAK